MRMFGSARIVTPGNGVQGLAAANAGVPLPLADAPAAARPLAAATPLAAAKGAPVADKDDRQPRMAQAFSQVVSVLMRDPSCKNLKIADLEWLVLPPLMSGQFRLAHAARPANGGPSADGVSDKERRIGALVPVAVALWARVSPLVDKALSENLETNVRLSPSAWTSGDILWLLAVAGNPRALPAFLKQLRENEFKGRQVKTRLRTPDGRIIVSNLGSSVSAA